LREVRIGIVYKSGNVSGIYRESGLIPPGKHSDLALSIGFPQKRSQAFFSDRMIPFSGAFPHGRGESETGSRWFRALHRADIPAQPPLLWA
jgi:hypothetical protein